MPPLLLMVSSILWPFNQCTVPTLPQYFKNEDSMTDIWPWHSFDTLHLGAFVHSVRIAFRSDFTLPRHCRQRRLVPLLPSSSSPPAVQVPAQQEASSKATTHHVRKSWSVSLHYASATACDETLEFLSFPSFLPQTTHYCPPIRNSLLLLRPPLMHFMTRNSSARGEHVYRGPFFHSRS
ncbi:hypothetical protein LY78DRAFT_122717 [Colletotrichum sublineola]|nr:hypothetical protein LY78DRAFT_122717 [Colletotrichum sublineola]